MLLLGLVFALITIGFVVPCLIDVARTPQFAIQRLSKRTWVIAIVLLSVIGALAWLVAGRPASSWPPPPRLAPLAGRRRRMRRAEAFRRHPAGQPDELGFDVLVGYPAPGQHRPLGPDDDVEFLKELERRIAEDRESDNGV
jgi:hypothetical protein